MAAPATALDTPIALDFLPGIQRDNTRFDAQRYLDAQWCRWRNGRPRKMGGCVASFNRLNGIPRKIHQFPKGNRLYCHVATSNGIQQVVTDFNGNFISSVDRTPAGMPGGALMGWTLDTIFDTTSTVVQLVAHPSDDLQFLAGGVPTIPFIGQVDGTSPLAPLVPPANLQGGAYTQPAVIGGICCVQPYLFAFDQNGLVYWSGINLPNTLGIAQGTIGAGQARISSYKIVAGQSLRGGGANSPAALFWSTAELLSATFIGGPAWFAFNTISPSTSILSSDCVIEYDGLYFWAGIDRFLVYNGTVVEVPNMQNQDWFFDNMNWEYAAKSFAFKVPRYGEIWFCAPLFGNTECSHAAIFNVRENYWYDTVLPAGGRSCGFYAQGLRYPMMGGVTPDPTTGGYQLFTHENGLDSVSFAGARTPLRSYYETGYFGGLKNTPADDRGMVMEMLEPDFIQTGDLQAWLLISPNARAQEVALDPRPIRMVPAVPQEQLASMKQPGSTARLARLHVESNQLGGNYIAGRSLLHVATGDARMVT